MLKKIFALSFVLWSLSLLNGCASMPPDVPICAEITPDRGACVMTMSGKEFEINESNKFGGKTYWEMKPAMLLMPADSWAKIKAWIIKTCHTTKTCGKVGDWERTVETVDQNIKKKLP